MVSENSIIAKDNTQINGNITAASSKDDRQAKNEDSITLDEEQSIAAHVNKKEEPYTIFSKSRLIQFLIITSLTGMLSPLTGSIYFPSVNQIEAVSDWISKNSAGLLKSLLIGSWSFN